MVLLISSRTELGLPELIFIGGVASFLLWTTLSVFWSVAPPAAVRELERGTLLLSALLSVMLLVRHHMRPVLGGVFGATVITSAYGLMTRLFPSRFGSSFDPIAGYRLDEPLGYWNAVGLFAVLGTLLAVGFAARGRTIAARALGSAAPLVLVPTLYFTFSRGAWGALAIGLAVAVAMDRRRLQLVTAILALSPLVALSLWFSVREPDLNRRTAALGGAISEGRRLAFILIGLTIASAFIGPALLIAEQKVRVGSVARRAFGGLLVAAVLAAAGAGVAHYGGPQHVASRTWDAVRSGPISVSKSGNLNQRLFSISSNGRLTQWRVAIDDYRAHPWFGSGAGTYEYSWLRDRPAAWKIRDAHNLYVEVLSELGPVGLALLLLTLSIPIYAAVKVRRHPLVPIALGVYVAFLLHAGVDWDWEMPALTIAGLLCGVAIMVVARSNPEGRPLTKGVRIGAVTAIAVVAAFAFVGLMGNLAIAASNNAARNSNWNSSASHARDAKRWMPWSSDPWRLQGEAQYVQGNFAAARANFRKAIDKDPNNWLLWADLATVGTHGTWRAPARRALALNPLAPELAEFRKALGGKG
jgi:O-antigen ligase